MTQITHVNAVIVAVADQDRAIEFYVDKLGFEKRTDVAYGEGSRWVEVAPPGADTTVALVPPREGESIAREGAGIMISFGTDDVDADHAELRSRGGNRFLIVERDDQAG